MRRDARPVVFSLKEKTYNNIEEFDSASKLRYYTVLVFSPYLVLDCCSDLAMSTTWNFYAKMDWYINLQIA